MEDLLSYFSKPKDPMNIKAIRLGLASPEKILEWSHGEVKKPETINYRTLKPERDGLFCAKIFGPVKDYECLCGKYKRMKHRGVICEKCGVEVIQSKVRRERMGHISLAAPVAHIWYLRSIPSKIGALLDMTLKELERVLYFESFVVTESEIPEVPVGKVLNEEEYQNLLQAHGPKFKIGIGAEAIKTILQNLNLEELSKELREEMAKTRSEAKRKKLGKRLRIVEALKESGNKPEWMILDVIPVIPPDLRPLVPLEGGRFATSDLNDLYRRVINRNNRLKRLMDLDAPDIIVRNEMRMLQEAVDTLFDNGRRGRPVTGPNRRPLKSLSDMLKGKQGRFRQNLLGKRVDYSGRSVIVVGPELRMHQCGLPKKMALELFKPFIYNWLEKNGHVTTIKSAKKMVEKEDPLVWDALDEIVKEHPIMLNRAPTLHRLGIQAFEPILIDSKAIQLHPLVCVAYNADFDGDQMAVHLPLSVEAQTECRVLLLSTNNILLPASGIPVVYPTQDMVLGIFYITQERPFARGEGRIFANREEAILAYEEGEVDLQAKVKVRMDGKLVETTVGRVLFSTIVPEEIKFEEYNKPLAKKALQQLIDLSYRRAGAKKTVIFADKMKDMGYYFATKAALSICLDNMQIPAKKQQLLEEAEKKVREIWEQYQEGLITDGERYNKVVDVWATVTEQVTEEMIKEMETKEYVSPDGKKKKKGPSGNPLYIMAYSGARGSKDQIRQLAGMRGLMAKPTGEIIETPIKSNFREGLSVLEYFISTHGARKGLADTALKTANAGYLTRRLVDVAQDCTITEEDCHTIDGIEVGHLIEGGEIMEPVWDRVLGRVALEDVEDPVTGEILIRANEEIDEKAAEKLREAGIEKVTIRSVLTCQSKYGVCAKCYGRDLATGRLVEIGEAVGVIAAQSIGEPGTQLTMRTFHIGGTASRAAEQSEHRAQSQGIVKFINLRTVRTDRGYLVAMNRQGEIAIITPDGREKERYPVVYGARILVEEGQKVNPGDLLVEWDPFTIPIITEVSGRVKFGDIIEGVTVDERTDPITGKVSIIVREYKHTDYRPRISIKDERGRTVKIPGKGHARYLLPVGAILTVNEGDEVKAGDIIAKIPRETTKTKDITGGLPRVAELFEARKPKEFAIISEIDGIVHFDKEIKGKRKLIIQPEVGDPKEYLIPKGKHIAVHEGDYVRAGEPLIEGSPNPHDILRVKGVKGLARFLVEEIQEVYRLQGVRINDKHFEVIVRQMLKKVKIREVGDTNFMLGELVDKTRFQEENERVLAMGGRPAVAEPLILGITKASLAVESFLAAASFQETTKVLTEASLAGKVDYLRGLKENIIIGRLIPAGTGRVYYDMKEEQRAKKSPSGLSELTA
ncbi:DNA-directed RNA polymerase, beta' subunit [Thermodesulfatator indicus DSM 15286]|uniref:DNA-directed RNA polymerase subunit beta' n=1 Tax=Thermodesulfatator indicus (strain DSM 15286 / JCM 11887 / CIR29812) TaxID=667014 RepID=F8A9V8_THEID|nr:DNA-directed RNA polymerase subunit beta' [Thermodesulfatator indicus]AEH44156.1 DNA-directed RNA polymerase, beta' subunit [Thermodesulfatator indicus DSM 15286]